MNVYQVNMDAKMSPPEDPRCVASKGLGEVLFESLQMHGDKVAQQDASTGNTTSFRDMLYKSICIAQEMKARGITDRDVTALCAQDSLDSHLPIIASLLLGMKTSTLNPSLSEHSLIRLLCALKPRIIFTNPEYVEKIECSLYKTGLKTEIVVFGETRQHTPISRFLNIRGAENTFRPRATNDVMDTALISFTSGTSGLPRAVCLSHYALLYHANHEILYNPSEVSLNCGNSWWHSGIAGLIKSILSGTKRIIYTKPNADDIFQHIQELKIDSIVMDAKLMKSFLQKENHTQYRTDPLKTLCLGGARMDEEELDKIRELLPSVVVANVYGMSELCGKTFAFHDMTNKKFVREKGASCGQPIPGISYKVVDIETENVVGPNTVGELRVKSKLLMNGYYNLHDDTAMSYDNEGFLRTGDLFYYDDDHCFHFVDRMQDLIKFQLYNISPSIIEKSLLSHPKVREAVVVEVSGQPMAVVTLKAGARITEKDLIDYVNSGLEDRNHLKGGIKFVHQIAKTQQGILLRREMRFMV